MAPERANAGGESRRIFEIDAMRGIAIVMMVSYNWLFALNYLGVYRSTITSGFWFYFARITASVFIILAGVALKISASKHQNKADIRNKCIRRGLTLLSLGMGITIITWMFLKGSYVRFGILHLIGLSIIIAYPFLKMRHWNLLLGGAIVAAGIFLQRITVDTDSFLLFGITPKNFYTVDYFPLLPWFGVFLIGVFLGNSLYENGARKYKTPEISGTKTAGMLAFLGRNSLAIYLVHQPVLIAALYLLGSNINF